MFLAATGRFHRAKTDPDSVTLLCIGPSKKVEAVIVGIFRLIPDSPIFHELRRQSRHEPFTAAICGIRSLPFSRLPVRRYLRKAFGQEILHALFD
jgi:hypothetical protein